MTHDISDDERQLISSSDGGIITSGGGVGGWEGTGLSAKVKDDGAAESGGFIVKAYPQALVWIKRKTLSAGF